MLGYAGERTASGRFFGKRLPSRTHRFDQDCHEARTMKNECNLSRACLVCFSSNWVSSLFFFFHLSSGEFVAEHVVFETLPKTLLVSARLLTAASVRALSFTHCGSDPLELQYPSFKLTLRANLHCTKAITRFGIRTVRYTDGCESLVSVCHGLTGWRHYL